MKIVSLVEGAVASKGGIGIVGVPLAMRSLAERGHQIVLLVSGGVSPGTEGFVTKDVCTALTRIEGAGTFGILSFQAWRIWAFSLGMIRVANKLVRDADLIYLNSLYSFPVLLGYLLARKYRKPYCIWPHGVLAPFQRKQSARKKWLYDVLIARKMLENAAVVFYAASGEQDEAAQLRLTQTSAIVPNGVDVGVYSELPASGKFRAAFMDGHKGPLVIFLSRLAVKKGLDLLIKAMAEVVSQRPEVRLAIIGGPDPPSFARQVQAWVTENGLESNAVITGFVSPEEKLQAFADADVFVLPSQAENFGLSIFEAMASRLPVVISDTLNYAGEIVRSAAGFSVPREPHAFAEAILQLVREPVLRRQMGENGLRLARRYSWANTAAKIECVSESIVRHNPLPGTSCESAQKQLSIDTNSVTSLLGAAEEHKPQSSPISDTCPEPTLKTPRLNSAK
jgi:glycosyltransferase involved in cell wall biosynthesis